MSIIHVQYCGCYIVWFNGWAHTVKPLSVGVIWVCVCRCVGVHVCGVVVVCVFVCV